MSSGKDGHRGTMSLATAIHHNQSIHTPPVTFRPPTGPDSPQYLSEEYSSQKATSHSSRSFMKGPKRKRLAKACDPCHRSKRRCDGTEPCLNCQWASKPCSYTDPSGRRVPPPNPLSSRPTYSKETPEPNPYPVTSTSSTPYSPEHPPSGPHPYATYGETPFPTATAAGPSKQISEYETSRKRLKGEFGSPIPAHPPIASSSATTSATFQLDHVLVFELTSLFFAHFPVARTIIHKPDFSRDLATQEVPMYLLYAICAVAAPFSQSQKIKTTPPRLSGRLFAQEALSLLFDGAGRLIQDKSLATAQTLCLMQLYEMMSVQIVPSPNERYHRLALQVIEHLGLMFTDHARLTPSPSREYVGQQMKVESLLRVFWFIQFLDLWLSVFYERPATINDRRLQLRLPRAETCFELAVTNILPEFLNLSPVKAVYSAEFAHLIRIMTIFYRIEETLREADEDLRVQELTKCYKQLRSWHTCLADELQYKTERVDVQKSMLITASNTGAWCFFHIHVLHASCQLALASAEILSPAQAAEASSRISNILNVIGGDLLKSSFLLASAAWALRKYSGNNSQQMNDWCVDIQDTLGLDIRCHSPVPPPDTGSSRFVGSSASPAGGELSVSPRDLKGRALGVTRLGDGSDSASISSRSGSHSPGHTSSGHMVRSYRLSQVEKGGVEVKHDGGGAGGSGSPPNSLPSLKCIGLLETRVGQGSSSLTPLKKRTGRSPPTPPPGLSSSSPSSASAAAAAENHGVPVGLAWLGREK